MSWSRISTDMNQGVRRLHTLGVMWGLGTAPDPDTISELIKAGYDQGMLSTAVAMGATNEQLLALPYPTDAATEADALMNLINQLGGALPPTGAPATAAISYPALAQPAGYVPPPTGTQVQNSLKASGAIPVGILSPTPPAQVQADQLQAGQGLIASAAYGAAVTGNPLTPGAVTVLPPALPVTFEQWLTANASWVIILFAALVLGPPLIKKL